jgi:hypothetical protein
MELYDGDLKLLESETFSDLHTLNFHLQSLASRRGIGEGLLVVHDREASTVELSMARDENSFFVS